MKEEKGAETAIPCPNCGSETRLQKLLRNAQIPPRYFGKDLKAYQAFDNNSQDRAAKRSVDYVEAFPNVPRGLLFVGPCGVGKTHLCVAILKVLIQEKRITGRFVDEAELLRRLQYSYGPGSAETEREVLVPLRDVDLLVWDDLGTGRATEWVGETIRTILNYRYTYNKQTVLSSNWPLNPPAERPFGSQGPGTQTLAERIGKRLFSRIMEMCEIVEIEGPDFRTEIHKARLDFEVEEAGRASRVEQKSKLTKE